MAYRVLIPLQEVFLPCANLSCYTRIRKHRTSSDTLSFFKEGNLLKILGVDYGDARTGLSISDPTGLLAGSPSVISEWNREKLLEKLTVLIQENHIERVVLGYPKNMDGSVGERAEKCAQLAADITARTAVPVILWDERRTTVEAHQILHQAGKKAKQHRKNVDAVAATLILQGYLDSQRLR